jgi:hypothetical protein
MNIYFNKGKENEEVITEEQISKMTRQELKNLKARCQAVQSEVSLKRQQFQAENEFEKNSSEFWKKMSVYKKIIGIFQKYIVYLNQVEKESIVPKEHADREHWLWCYYQESMKVLTESMVQQISEMADTRAKFHVDFEKQEYNK